MTVPLIFVTAVLAIIGFFMARSYLLLDKLCDRMVKVEEHVAYLRGQHDAVFLKHNET